MYLKVGNQNFGTVHLDQHVIDCKPRNYFSTNNLLVDAEELLTVLASLSPHRQWSADLHHFVWCCTPVAGMPQTTLVAGAVEWSPHSEVVLRIGTIPFSREDMRGFLRWLHREIDWVQKTDFPLQTVILNEIETTLLGLTQ